jgi:hypothetical protein
VNSRNSQRRDSLRHCPNDFHATRFQRKHRGGNNAADYDEKCDWFVLEKNLSNN